MDLLMKNKVVKSKERKRAIILLLVATLFSMFYIDKNIRNKEKDIAEVLNKYNIRSENYLEEIKYNNSKVKYDLFEDIKGDLDNDMVTLNENVVGMIMPNLHLGSPAEYEVENINLQLKDFYNYDKDLLVVYIPSFSHNAKENILKIENFAKKKDIDVIYLDIGSSFDEINKLSKEIDIEGKVYKNYNNYEVDYFKGAKLPLIYVNNNGVIELILDNENIEILNNLL